METWITITQQVDGLVRRAAGAVASVGLTGVKATTRDIGARVVSGRIHQPHVLVDATGVSFLFGSGDRHPPPFLVEASGVHPPLAGGAGAGSTLLETDPRERVSGTLKYTPPPRGKPIRNFIRALSTLLIHGIFA